jgi:hypothetical protein
MEHTLQVLLVVVFSWQASTRLAERPYGWAGPCMVAALSVATRYESLFLVGIVCALLLWQKRLKPVFALGIASAAPVVAFAVYSVAHGGLVLPNSVLMKSDPGRFATVGGGISAVTADWIAIVGIFHRPPQFVLIVGVLAALLLVPYSRLAKPNRPVWLAIIFASTSIVHS